MVMKPGEPGSATGSAENQSTFVGRRKRTETIARKMRKIEDRIENGN